MSNISIEALRIVKLVSISYNSKLNIIDILTFNWLKQIDEIIAVNAAVQLLSYCILSRHAEAKIKSVISSSEETKLNSPMMVKNNHQNISSTIN